MIVRGGRRETNKTQARTQGGQTQLFVFLRRQIDDDHSVDARGFRFGQEFIHAVDVNWIVIAHQNDGGIRVVAAKFLHLLQDAPEGHTGVHRAQSRRLDGGAIGHRIGKWHPDLDDIGARFGQSIENFLGYRRVGIAGHDECDKRYAILGAALRETCFDARSHGLAG